MNESELHDKKDVDLSHAARERIRKATNKLNKLVQESKKFENTIDSLSKNKKPLGTRERNNLLTVIMALLDHCKINPEGKDTATDISSMTQKKGRMVGRDTIKKYLADGSKLF